ncbi:MAG: single-stranded DNA-binding protein [bacterium]
MNRIILTGRMTTDAELRQTANGKMVTNFNIAVDRQFRNAQGEKETDFITVVLWEKSAEFVSKYCGKGRLIAVEGRLEIRKYQDKDGNNRIAPEVIGDRVEGLDRAQQDGGGGGQYQNQNQNNGYTAPRNAPPPPTTNQAAATNTGDWEMPPIDNINDPFDDQ